MGHQHFRIEVIDSGAKALLQFNLPNLPASSRHGNEPRGKAVLE